MRAANTKETSKAHASEGCYRVEAPPPSPVRRKEDEGGSGPVWNSSWVQNFDDRHLPLPPCGFRAGAEKLGSHQAGH